MKNIGIIVALLGGFYLVTKKDTIKKQLTAIGSNDIVGVDDFSNIVRPSNKNPSTGPGTNPNVSSSDYSEVPSPTGRTLTIEGGNLNLATEILGYKAYHNDANGNWVSKIPRVPQYIGSLEGKIFTTEYNDLYVVVDGFSYKVYVPYDPTFKWGVLHPEDAILVTNVPMWFLDKYPMKGIFSTDFQNPILL